MRLFECGIVICIKWAGVSISKTADLVFRNTFFFLTFPIQITLISIILQLCCHEV